SKAFGLAGLRVGFAVGSEELIYELDKAIPPFS
ncbi:aminotransferase class I/II-fold pyridoxal phosphate-dependent enzyme, partial [Streptococcus suis]